MPGKFHLDKIYRRRFNEYECEQKDKIWKVLCPHFFQQFVPEDGVVLDLGAGYCEFINNIHCKKKYAVDLNDDTPKFANPDVTVVSSYSTELDFLEDDSIDLTFMSNFLEHLKTKKEVIISSDKSPKKSPYYNNEQIRWLYVVPKYPCDLADLDFKDFKDFNGYSNHCPHILAPLTASILGAKIIEVHITSDKSKKFFDNNVSFDYNELEELVKLIRLAEKIKR